MEEQVDGSYSNLAEKNVISGSSDPAESASYARSTDAELEHSEDMDSEAVEDDLSQALGGGVPEEGSDEHRVNFLRPLFSYFKDLEERLINELASEDDTYDGADSDAEDFSDIEAGDQLRFDEISINAAMGLCDNLHKYLSNDINNTEFLAIRQIHSFYESPEQLLEMVKLMFLGNIAAKEKITRIYGAKAFGTYKVTQIILETRELFQEAEDPEKARSNLQRYAEEPLQKLKLLFPESKQSKIPDSGKELANGVRQVLADPSPLFEKGDDYGQIVDKFRDFVFCLYGNAYVLKYVEWKDKYLRFWLFRELTRLDIQNMMSANVKVPQFSLMKIKIYQQLDSTFYVLDRADRVYDKTKNLKKMHTRALSHGEGFLANADDATKAELEKARVAEKALLDALNPSQVACIASRVHEEIAQIRRNKKLKGKAPANANTRSVDLGPEKQADKKYMAATLKVQASQIKEEGRPKAAHFLKALSGLANKLRLLPRREKKAAPAPEPEAPPEPKIIPRGPGNMEEPLEPADVDWVGFGRDYKSTVYDRTMPNLQKRFFEHGEFKLRMYDDFKKIVATIFEYYGDLGYTKQVNHKVGVSVDGSSGVKEFLDEAVYLKTGDGVFVALGRAPFSKNADPTPYFQLYRTQPFRPQTGTIKGIDYSKTVGGVKYDMEHVENSTELRPLLFNHLIRILDSLPDSYRNEHQDFLKGAYHFLEEFVASQEA